MIHALDVDPAKFSVLVIDDEPVVLRSCCRILTKAGYRVTAILDSREGLDKALVEGFDILVVDLMMPEIDGMEILKTVKEQRPDTEVIMITGY